MNLTGKQIIGFETKASGHRNFQGVQAASGEALPQVFVEATAEEAEEAPERFDRDQKPRKPRKDKKETK